MPAKRPDRAASAGESKGPERPLFRARHRLTHKREFDAVYAGKARKSPDGVAGAITVFAIRNDLGHCRLGLSVGRRIGGAVQRNRVKRLLREAFRTARPGWDAGRADGLGAGLDLVINVRPHPPCRPERYAEMLTWCVSELRTLLEKRSRRRTGGTAPGGAAPGDAAPVPTQE